MNEENISIKLPCDVDGNDSLDVVYWKEHNADKQDDFMSYKILEDGVIQSTVILTHENAVKLRDFLIENLG